jgi:hypothetical protein
MAGKNANYGRPIPSPEKLPNYLKEYEKKSTPIPNFTVDDFAWCGDDGNLDPQPIVDQMIAPAALLRLAVQAIVGGNPSSDKSVEDRVEAAMRALLGTGGRKGRRNRSSDESILRRMAIEYREGFHGFKDSHPSLNALADWALRAEPGFAEQREEWKENRRRTISRRFEKFQDRLMIEVSSNYDWEVQSAFAKVSVVLSALRDLGIHLQSQPEQDNLT